MPRHRSSRSNWRFTLLALAVAGFLAYAQWKGWLPKEGAVPPPPVITTERSQPPKKSSSAPGAPAMPPDSRRASGAWEELHGCTLVEDRGNDGDSFEVMHDGQRLTLRLYFADCPEKYRHQFNGARLAEQGRYFGGLTEEETVAVGEEARDFALERLREAPFTVLTRWEPVFDSERRYGFVAVREGDLAELLVSKGLARIFTKGEDRPGGSAAATEKKRLQFLESQAKDARAGAWGRRQE